MVLAMLLRVHAVWHTSNNTDQVTYHVICGVVMPPCGLPHLRRCAGDGSFKMFFLSLQTRKPPGCWRLSQAQALPQERGEGATV